MTNGGTVELDHVEHGRADGPVVLVVTGLGAQRSWWPDWFVAALAERHRVLLPDQRDAGRSPRDGSGWDQARSMAWLGGQREQDPPYSFADLAADHVAVLDRLGIERAHVVGASMGGMVAQHLAFSHPERVLSLTAIMTTTGARDVSLPTPEAGAALLATLPTDDRDAYVAAAVENRRIYGSPEPNFDAAGSAAMYGSYWDVGLHPEGSLRQYVALVADSDRTSRSATITAPTVVVHGSADPLVPPAGGRALAAVIEGATFHEIAGLGHDLPSALRDEVLAPVLAHLAEVEATR
jgi:pimeloyl-ACP methyl ester carboxylesterase